jgi:hypothetical protein
MKSHFHVIYSFCALIVLFLVSWKKIMHYELKMRPDSGVSEVSDGVLVGISIRKLQFDPWSMHVGCTGKKK